MTKRQKAAMIQVQDYLLEIPKLPVDKVPKFCGYLWNLVDDTIDDLPRSIQCTIEQLDEMLGESKMEGK